MAKRETIQILILGPMERVANDRVVIQPRTVRLRRVVRQIVREISATRGYDGPRVQVTSPESMVTPLIVKGVLDLIEDAELVIIDMSEAKANVAYEVGLVHALGLPYLLVCSEERPPFYFQPVNHIARFSAASRFDPRSASHRRLRSRIRDFLTKPAAAARMTDNQVTNYFKLPIIDISGPSGLASGYFVNSIRRFVRPGGYFDKVRRLRFKGPNGEDRSEEVRVERFIAVRPPSRLTETYLHDRQILDRSLQALGYRLMDATILTQDGDPEDLRTYGGLFLFRDGRNGPELVKPAMVVEIPTTLYALQFAPRIRRLDDLEGRGLSDRVRARLRQRRLDGMMSSFEDVMRFQFRVEAAAGKAKRYRMVDVDELPAVLPRSPGPRARRA